MKVQYFIFTLLIMLLLMACSEDYLAEGTKAYNQKNYILALKYFKQLDTQQLQNPEIREMMALAFMNRGKEFYVKTKNIDSFEANYKASEKIKPESQSQSFKTEYSRLLVDLAQCYANAAEKNSAANQEFVNHSFDAIEYALSLDSTNVSAKELRASIQESTFESNLKIAQENYDRAKKLARDDLMLVAKSYVQRASDYNAGDKRVKKLSRQINRSLLPVLDPQAGLALAVTETLRSDDYLKLVLAVESYLNESVKIDPKKFYLVDYKGNKYGLHEKEMQFVEYSKSKSLKPAKLDRKNPYIDGILAFKIPKKIPVSYLAYYENGEEITRKYFQ